MFRRSVAVIVAAVLAFVGAADASAADMRSDHERALDHARHVASFKTCSRQRSDAVACAMRFADVDHDGAITAKEIDTAKEHYLSLKWRVGAWIADHVGHETTPEIMRKCDADGDGRITLADFERSADTCLADCSRVELLFDIICTHAYEEERVIAHNRIVGERFAHDNSRSAHGVA